jgi:Spy/CpxP family protein refolding chaperone
LSKNRVGLVAIVALLCAAPSVAQQPAPRDTTRHGMTGHQMPAQGMAQHQAMQAGAMPGGMAHDSTMGCGIMSGGGGMMAVMAPEPAHLLEMKAELRLTADQERRITAIRDAAQPAHAAAMQSGDLHARELAQAMRAAAPDTVAVRNHFEATHAAMGRAHLVMLLAAAQARAVLTDEQRRQVDGMHEAMGQARPQQPAHRHQPEGWWGRTFGEIRWAIDARSRS